MTKTTALAFMYPLLPIYPFPRTAYVLKRIRNIEVQRAAHYRGEVQIEQGGRDRGSAIEKADWRVSLPAAMSN